MFTCYIWLHFSVGATMKQAAEVHVATQTHTKTQLNLPKQRHCYIKKKKGHFDPVVDVELH